MEAALSVNALPRSLDVPAAGLGAAAAGAAVGVVRLAAERLPAGLARPLAR